MTRIRAARVGMAMLPARRAALPGTGGATVPPRRQPGNQPSLRRAGAASRPLVQARMQESVAPAGTPERCVRPYGSARALLPASSGLAPPGEETAVPEQEDDRNPQGNQE